MTSSKTLFFLCTSFIIGVFLESVANVPQMVLWAFLLLGILSVFLSFVFHKNFVVAGFCVLFLLLGILRVQISEFNIANDKLSKLNGQGEVVLTGIVSGEPDVRESSQKLKVKVDGNVVLVTTGRYPEYGYSDKIKLTGKLKEPEIFEDFNYKNYLLKDGIYSVMDFPKIEVLGKAGGDGVPIGYPAVYEGILQFKQKMRQSIENNLLPPQSSLARGIILGDKSAVSQELKDKFRITGLSHVIAVSGMHVAILSFIVMSALLLLGLWRQQAFLGVLIFIFVYVLLVGMPSSAVRAGIMAIIYLCGQALGRQSAGARTLILAAAAMLLQNPLLLFYDIGFQLSFLAVLGLMYLEPILRWSIKNLSGNFCKIKIEGKTENALMMLTATLAAQIFTLPVIIYNFGTVSFVSPLTNILVLPVLYPIMLFGFLSSLAGVFVSQLGWIISLPNHFLLSYFLSVVDFFAKPWAYKDISGILWLYIPVFYSAAAGAIWFLNKKYSRELV